MASAHTDEPVGEVKPFYTFPPFPTPPPGVTILSFTDFKEPGIVVQIDADGTDGEVDGRGVSTLTLNSRHDLTREEKKMGKKRLANATQVTADGTVRRVAWHEEWRSHEKAHRFAYDPASSEFDRLWQASWDFKNSRAWPPTTNPLSNLWDQIRLYIGLITSIQPLPSKRKKGGQIPATQDDDDGDDDDEFTTLKEVPLERVDDAQEGLRIARERSKAAAQDNKPPLDDAARELLREQRDAKKDQRMQEFLYETETAVKIFFSAHWRDKGLAWDKTRSESCPILMGFFLRFLLFVNAFPEPDIQRGLQRALKITELAEVELPATFVVAKQLEDGVSKGFQQFYGTKTNTLKLWDDDDKEATLPVVDPDVDANFPSTQNVVAVDAEEASADSDDTSPTSTKKRRLESGEAAPAAASTTEDDVIVINSNDMNVDEAALKDAIADNVDVNGVEVSATGGWGGAWGSGVPGGWGDGNNTDNGGWAEQGSPTLAAQDIDSEWKFEEDLTLSNLLGETAKLLSDTHTTGIVERSTRRVVRVVKPSEATSKPAKGKLGTPEAVEAELESKLGYAVLAPWKKIGNHIGSDVTIPVLQDSSRGDDFDPSKEEIQVLLDPASCDKIPIGVGLTATWIQLARKARNDKPGKQEKGAPGENGPPTKWWYMEQFMATLTSFHTDRYYPDQA